MIDTGAGNSGKNPALNPSNIPFQDPGRGYTSLFPQTPPPTSKKTGTPSLPIPQREGGLHSLDSSFITCVSTGLSGEMGRVPLPSSKKGGGGILYKRGGVPPTTRIQRVPPPEIRCVPDPCHLVPQKRGRVGVRATGDPLLLKKGRGYPPRSLQGGRKCRKKRGFVPDYVDADAVVVLLSEEGVGVAAGIVAVTSSVPYGRVVDAVCTSVPSE